MLVESPTLANRDFRILWLKSRKKMLPDHQTDCMGRQGSRTRQLHSCTCCTLIPADCSSTENNKTIKINYNKLHNIKYSSNSYTKKYSQFGRSDNKTNI